MDKNGSPTIIIKSGKTIRQIEIAELLYIECDCYVCTLSMADGSKINSTHSLSYFENKLSQWRFERISRDVIISLKQVAVIKSKSNNRKIVIMIDSREFNIAFRRWKHFKEVFYR